jgi:hypothetical protein
MPAGRQLWMRVTDKGEMVQDVTTASILAALRATDEDADGVMAAAARASLWSSPGKPLSPAHGLCSKIAQPH